MTSSPQIRAISVLVFAGLVALAARDVRAATAAYDNACNGAIVNGSGSADGTGFGNWSVSLGGGGSTTLTSSTGNGANPGVNNSACAKAWGLFADGGSVGVNYAFAARPFTAGSTPNAALQSNQTFTIDYEIGGVDGTGGMEGFALLNSSGQTNFYIKWTQGAATFTTNGTGTIANPTYTEAGMRVAVTLTSTNTYNLVITSPTNGTVYTYNGGTLLNPSGGEAISQVQLFANGSGSTTYGNTYEDVDFFNNMGITCPTMSVSTPANDTTCVGNNASFSVTVTGGSAPVYQWLKGGSPVSNGGTISGANTANLTLTGVASGDSNTTWSCAVTNACGTVVTSASATLSISSSTSITSQPGNTTVCSGSSVSFTVGASGATAYQWYQGPTGSGTMLNNGGTISGATSATLTLSSASTGGNYYVVVSGCGSPITSSGATLTVSSTLGISTQPVSQQTGCNGSTAAFTVTGSGSPLNYAWRKRGTGWGANSWTLVGGGGGFLIGSSTANAGGNIDTNGVSWGLENATSSSPTYATRTFPSPLQVGQQFQIDMQNVNVTTGEQVGFNLLNANGTVVWGYFFVGGNAGGLYSITDNSGTYATTLPWAQGNTGMRIVLTLTSPTTYSVTVQTAPIAGGGSLYGPYTGTLLSPVGGSVPDGMQLYDNNGNNTTYYGLYFNSIIVNGVADDNASAYNSSTWASGQTPNLGDSPLSNGGSVSGSASSTLTLSGVTANDSGSSFDVVLTNSCGYVRSSAASLTAGQGPSITSATPLPAATAGTAYSDTITESGGVSPYTYTISGGSLPLGLSINSSGAISGTPTGTTGTANFTVEVTDNNGCSSTSNLAITVTCSTVTVSPGALPAVTIGMAYTQTVSAVGGTGPYTFLVTGGATPSGINLSSSGVLAGTYSGSPGNASFTITATDANGCMGSQAYSVQMSSCPDTLTVLPGSLPGGTVGTAYSQTNSASGGTGPFTFTITAGNLPNGLSLTTAGVLSGTPIASGTYNFTVLVTNVTSCTGTKSYSVTVTCPTITLAPSSPLPGGTVGTAYSAQTITASGGTGPYAYAVTSGSLPPGLTLSSGGIVSGTPLVGGTFTFTVTASDSYSCTGSQSYSLTTVCPGGGCTLSYVQPTDHWKLDNDLTDSEGSHNGTMQGTENHVFGEIGKALSLNGASQVSLGSGVVPTTAYTKSAWVWVGAAGANSIFSGDDTTSRHVLWVNSSNGNQLSAGHNGSYTAVEDNTPLPLSNWVHVAVSYDSSVNGGTMKLYKNGALVGGSQAIASNVAAAAAGTGYIGGFNGGNYFNGIIDDVGLWNTALSDADIYAIYQTGLKHVPCDRVTNSVFNFVPEANNYTILYELPIPTSQNLGTNGWPPYITDYSQAYNNPFGFDRVAYYMELQTTATAPYQWVYVSMDRISTNTINLGVPSVISGSFFQQDVTNMDVFSNTGVVGPTGTNIQTGNIEFWGWSYTVFNGSDVPNASSNVYDCGDTLYYEGTYGSMQIHNHATGCQTLLAYNAWANGGNSDIGIGNAGTANTDWTFSANAGNYAVKNLLVLIRPATLPNVTFSSVPKNLQLYPRNRETQMADVPVTGTVNDPGYDHIVVNVTRAGAPYTNITQALTYVGGQASFSLAPAIYSELAEYGFTVSLVQGVQTTQVASAQNVVAGDVILVNGQSNAEAQWYVGFSDSDQNEFLRSFGSRAGLPACNPVQAIPADLNWRIAEGDMPQDPGAVGQWELTMGNLIVTTYQIPVVIINGAYPGEPITYFPRNNSNPIDLTTNYGDLLYRVQQAGVQNAVRTLLFFQGESDSDNGEQQESGFLALYRNWLKDYPTIEKMYEFQVRAGCTVTQTLGDLRNRQRLYADKFPGAIETMTTEGIDGRYNQAGLGYCHYQYVTGYQTIGQQIFAVMARDLYGAAATSNLDSLNFAYAYFSNPGHTEITIITRNATDSITFESGAQADFFLEGSGVTVTSGSASGNKIVLELSGNPTSATGISYEGHAGGVGSWVLNSTGVGMLTFYNQMINLSDTTAPGAPAGLSATTYSSTEQDLSWSATSNAVYYIILRNGVQIGQTYGTVYYDMTVTPGSSYQYSVEAVGLTATSAPSASITAPISVATEQQGGLIASDNAGDIAYSPAWPYQWLSGYNGGYGYGAWTLSAINTGGFFMGDSTQNGATIPSGGINVYNSFNGLNLSWGLWANNSGGSPEIVADRPFNLPLAVGQTFELYVDTGENTGREGFVLRTGNNTANKNAGERFEFLNIADGNYEVYGSVLTNTAVPWTDGGVRVDFTLTGVDTYSVTLSGLVSQVSQTLTGTLQGVSGSPINSVALYNENTTSGTPNYDLYFNSMSIIGGAQIGSIQLSGTNVLVSFGTAAGFTYDLQTTTNLVGGTWSTVISNIQGTGSTMTLTNGVSPGAPNQYYRLGSCYMCQ